MLNQSKGILVKFSETRTFKGIALCLAINILAEIIQPTAALALTEGPSQPEVQSFEPVGTTQMVDLFTGDFNYNIPLFNLPGPNGGYPVNLAYHAGVTMDDEASWVGLGWNLNVGALVRNMRGLPDEFFTEVDASGSYQDGDFIETKTDIKPNWTFGVNLPHEYEVMGGQIVPNGISASLYYNNYRGLGVKVGYRPDQDNDSKYSYSLSLDSENGVGYHPRLNLTHNFKRFRRGVEIGVDFDGDLSINAGLTTSSRRRKDWRFANKLGSGYSFANNNFTPSIGMSKDKFSLAFQLTNGTATYGAFNGSTKGVYFNREAVSHQDRTGIKRPVAGYAEAGNFDNVESRFYTKDFTRERDGNITRSTTILPSAIYTNDIYQSTGQGLAGYFRGRRNDVGKVHDPYLYNDSWGASLEFEYVQQEAVPAFEVTIPVDGVLQTFNFPAIAPSQHFGGGANISWGSDIQSFWSQNNELDFDFENNSPQGIKENFFYQIHGEKTVLHQNEYDNINGTDLALVTFHPIGSSVMTGGDRSIWENENNIKSNRSDIITDNSQRVVRNTLIHSLKNKEVSYLGDYTIKHYNFDVSLDLTENPEILLNRNSRDLDGTPVSILNHNAGFKVLNEEGAYYVYGLPAYNIKEVENQFSIDNSGVDLLNDDIVEIIDNQNEVEYEQPFANHNNYINKSTKSPYAHSYLLTSVQGADYVDIDNNGPSNNDLGYWVKFDYVRYADKVKWKAPFAGANYNRGESYTGKDDMGSYQFGEKEQWYLGRIETKSHIAIFHLSERNDMKEAEGEFENESEVTLNDNKSGLKLDKIEIFEKQSLATSNPVPLQVVHFKYEYELCPESPNSISTTKGKLTLKELWFTSNGSDRGELSKYEFDYSTVNLDPSFNNLVSPTNPENLINPEYKRNAYNSWSGFFPYSGTYEKYSKFPYVAQTVNSWGQSWMSLFNGSEETLYNKKLIKTANDLIASSYCLRQIKLPSGSTINIDYESDDYSHVQHKIANQMFKIVKFGFSPYNDPNRLYNHSQDYTLNHYGNNPEWRRIYFKLEQPIDASTSLTVASNKIYDNYVEPIIKDENGDRNLYFKSKVSLKSNVDEFISGYLPLEVKDPDNYGVDINSIVNIDGVNCYTTGFVTIKCLKRKNGTDFNRYHPISLLSWQYMQSNAQELLNPASGFSTSSSGAQSAGDVISMLTNFIGAIPAAAASFSAIRPYCKNLGFAEYVDLENSGIRLASPDRVKYGGGHRVREISITDNWSLDTEGNESSRTYGQHFDYTIDEGEGIISSGVAQYEPQIGGDENALKYPIHYHEKQTVITSNNLMMEAPINQSLFPGPSVGYRKVTVSSINTNNLIKNMPSSDEGRTSGVTVHEFFTAKEFPTRFEYSVLKNENNTREAFHVPIFIPFIGDFYRTKYYGSQAFKIELNDMHGKPKSVRTFEINSDYTINENAITESIYEYQKKPISYQEESVYELDNTITIMPNDGSHDLDQVTNSREMGVEAELFTDQREHKSQNISVGLGLNLEFMSVLPPVIVPTLMPSISDNRTTFRTYVTNKVVHRSGILKRIKTRDIQTVNESEILAYDEKSGVPMLTKVKNEFGEDLYKYNVPAYYHYDRMGHAYQNINFEFVSSVPPINTVNGEVYFQIDGSNLVDYLVRGDELLIKYDDEDNPSANNNYLRKAYFLGWVYSGSTPYAKFHIPNGVVEPSASVYRFKVIRSGRRNHYSSIVTNYLTKGQIDPNLSAIEEDLFNGVITTPKIESSIVLSASASLYKDDWAPSNMNIGDPKDVKDPFINGNSGIWRPYKSYSYVGSRSTAMDLTSNQGGNPELFNDGTMQNVPMFSWKIGPIEDYTSNWEWVNEVTRYSSDAFELENMNRIDVYSSALYGYDNSLSIGVGANASMHELGVMDFEKSTVSDFNTLLNQTNFNFDNNHQASGNNDLYVTEKFNVEVAWSQATNQIIMDTDIPFSCYTYLFGSGALETNVFLELVSWEATGQPTNENYFFNAGITKELEISGGTNLTLVPYIENEAETLNVLKDGGTYYGKITLLIKKPYMENPTGISYVDTKSHTGKQSMKVTSTSVFDQPKLKLIKDKEYVLSLWVSRDNLNVSSFDPSSLVSIGTMSGSIFNSITPIKTSTSKIIEGWQKIDFEFKVALDHQIFAVQFTPGASPVYIDDVRFSPKEGGISTYVYDPNKFWLRASLNADNYATFYYYDEQGSLTLKKQETEEGIFTITESRGHVSEY